MPNVELGPSRELGLIRRFDALFFVPPGPTAVEVRANVRRADDSHDYSPHRKEGLEKEV